MERPPQGGFSFLPQRSRQKVKMNARQGRLQKVISSGETGDKAT